ncbi:hypothetical protein RAB80_014390 [Fusarium oxysporum f. sp. vasinfectum]|nr:hypothetical protein RAB80_014336 [Fusarium oxysporum f. sp. vasinfectum]KAK2670253.1 hypothetical protein RAB80_014390 [Fusarium oxysporum f. sp. vasinfectum]KAK2926545.1 hypothetical protein FoTM2_013413 [Fusarium oxysporum f. sp. vasinfectum]
MAVIAYIMWLERSGFPCNQQLIEEAANELRASRTPPAAPVGDGWYRRFLQDNPQLQKKKLVRAFDRERAGFEAGDIADLEQFYANLGVVVEERDIEASQMFNADECGIRIGALRERLEVIIIKKMLNAKHEVVSFSNRESTTMLGCANAAGYAREVARHLKRNYREGFSSPTRQSFGVLEDVICEAVVLNSFAEEHIQSRLDRIAASNNKRNKRKKVMPSGKYINSVTVEQVRESLNASTKKDRGDELRRQRRNLKQLRKEEDERLKEEWRKSYKYDINNNGKPIHISFERWKKWKQLDIYDEIICMSPLSRESSPTPQEGFFYDTSGSAQQKRFHERLRNASAAGFY